MDKEEYSDFSSSSFEDNQNRMLLNEPLRMNSFVRDGFSNFKKDHI